MAEIIPAFDLEVGDVYRAVRGTLNPHPHGDAYRVNAVRTVRTVETYTVIEACNVRTGLAAQINLIRDITVAKLAVAPIEELRDWLTYMPEGDTLHIVRADGQFWC